MYVVRSSSEPKTSYMHVNQVVRLFLLGPKAVRNKTKILKCRAKTYKITNITGEIIMYAAVHVCSLFLFFHPLSDTLL